MKSPAEHFLTIHAPRQGGKDRMRATVRLQKMGEITRKNLWEKQVRVELFSGKVLFGLLLRARNAEGKEVSGAVTIGGVLKDAEQIYTIDLIGAKR